MKNIASFYNVMSSAHGKFIDDERFCFIGTESGAFQVWEGYFDGSAPKQLSFSDNRVWNLGGADSQKNIYFTMDTGGDEQEQIYRIDAKTREVKNLTNNPAARHNFGGITPDCKTVILACNARNPGSFDICALDVATGKIDILLENHDNYNTPCGLSPNGRYLLYNKMHGSAENYMWMFDIQTKTAIKIDEKGTNAQYVNPAWNKDSTGFYLVTDKDWDVSRIAYYDISKKTLEIQHAERWDIESIALSADNRYIAMSINENGYMQLKVWDILGKSELNIPMPPKGTAQSGFCFAPHGHKLMFAMVSGKRAADIWLLDIDADTLCRVTSSSMGDITSDDLVEPTLHSFSSFDGLNVPFWVWRKQSGAAPVVIDIHGGPEGQEMPQYKPLTAYLVDHGYTVVAPNVRGSSGYGKKYQHLDDVEKRMDSVQDIEYLVKYIIAEGIAKPDAIAVMGGSYGGFMTLACITEYPDLFACAIDTVGICNFETFLENTSEYRRVHRESEYGTLKNDRAVLHDISPIHKIDKIKCPLMVIHGARDPRVPIGEAEQVVKNLSERGVSVKYLRYEDEGHGLAKLKNKLDCYPQVADFLAQYLI